MKNATPCASWGRRLGAWLASFLVVLGITQGVTTPEAHALPAYPYQSIEWDITGLEEGRNPLAAGQYDNMIRQLREIAATPIAAGMGETTQERGHVIEVQVVRYPHGGQRTHNLSLYFWAHDLYLIGFTSQGYNYRFEDTTDLLRQREHAAYPNGHRRPFTDLRYTGSYSDLGASESTRASANMNYQGWTLAHHLDRLGNVRDNRPSSQEYGRSIAHIIGATSEAARMGWIQNRVSNTIRQGGDGAQHFDYLGTFGASLENNWGRLSALVNNLNRGSAGSSVNVDGSRYRTLDDITRGPSGAPDRRLSVLITKGGLYR
ncbi:ribosome-inactivating family protein [Streptomyces venezuelae]|uniref:ribosome-inactivating family protein n=1 Tax=Streptomyces venezuelae TaxID=54571 RepID=UPI00365260B0